MRSDFTVKMVDAFLCYVLNTYPGLPEIFRSLDSIVRNMVRSRCSAAAAGDTERLVPDIERFLQNQDTVFPTAPFAMPSISESGLEFLEFD